MTPIEARLIDSLKWIMPKIHQAYHDGVLEECGKATCAEYRSAMAAVNLLKEDAMNCCAELAAAMKVADDALLKGTDGGGVFWREEARRDIREILEQK